MADFFILAVIEESRFRPTRCQDSEVMAVPTARRARACLGTEVLECCTGARRTVSTIVLGPVLGAEVLEEAGQRRAAVLADRRDLEGAIVGELVAVSSASSW